MDRATAVQFSALARALAAEARRLGLAPPGFRSPPRRQGIARSIRHGPGGTVVVAVRLAGRPLDAVAADMVEGIVAANHLHGDQADAARSRLRAAVAHHAA